MPERGSVLGGLAFVVLTLAAFVAVTLAWGNYTAVSREKLVSLRYDKAIIKLQEDAKASLLAERYKVLAAETRLGQLRIAQESIDAKNLSVVASLQRQLSGRLRDPNATECRDRSGSPEAAAATTAYVGGGDTAQTGRLLSEELSGLLSRLSLEADQINAAYQSCRQDSLTLREVLAK